MSKQFKIKLNQTPPSVNHYCNTTINKKTKKINRFKTDKARNFIRDFRAEYHKVYPNEPVIETPVTVEMKLVFKNPHLNDIDNFCKIPFDALSGVCYKDDKQIVKMTVEKFKGKEPSTEVIVTECQNSKK